MFTFTRKAHEDIYIAIRNFRDFKQIPFLDTMYTFVKHLMGFSKSIWQFIVKISMDKK